MFNHLYQVPDKRKIRYIVHADAYNEADDQYTIAHALMMEKFEIELWQVPIKAYRPFATSLAELQLKVRPCGEIGRYLFGHGYRPIRVYHTLDARLDLEDLFAKLRINFG